MHDKLHGSTHEYEGEDEFGVDSLSGLLADAQYTRVMNDGAFQGISTILDFDIGLHSDVGSQGAVVTLDASLEDLYDVDPPITYDVGKVLVADGSKFHSDYLSHSALSGLNEDDHLQYLPRDGLRPMYGNLDMGGQEITNVTYVDGIDISEHDHDGDAPQIPMEGLMDISGFSKLDLGKYVDRPDANIEHRVYASYDSQVGFWYDDGSSWSALTTKDHQSLSGIKSDDHHSRYTDGEALTAINTDSDHGSTAQHDYFTSAQAVSTINNDTDHGTTAQHNYFSGSHDDLTNVSSNDHINNITDIPNRGHDDLSNINSSDHHVKTGDDDVYGLTRYQGSGPIGPSAGMTYMDSDNNVLYVYDGTGWQGAQSEAQVGLLSDLDDVNDINYNAGNVIRASGTAYYEAKLSHTDLTNISNNDHHNRYTDTEAEDAINADADHGITASHDYTEDDEIYGLLHYQSTAPTGTMPGLSYVDSSNRTLYTYDGTSFVGVKAEPKDVWLEDLDDVQNVTYADGQVLRAQGSHYAATTLKHTDLDDVQPDQHHIAFIGIEGEQNGVVQPDTYDHVQFTGDDIVDVDAIYNPTESHIGLSIVQSNISHDSISGVSPDDHHNAFIGLEDENGTSVDPALDNRIQINGNDTISIIGSANALNLSASVGNIHHDSLLGLTSHNHHYKTGDDEIYGLTYYQSNSPDSPSAGTTYMDQESDVIYVYDGADWQGAQAEAAVGQLSDLTDVSNVSYTDGYVLRADGAQYASSTLDHTDLTGIGSDDHHIKYTDEEAQDAVGTIIEGSGATTVSYDDTSNTITVSSTDTDTQLDRESVQDYAWGVLTGTQDYISVVYDDENDEVGFSVEPSTIDHNNLINSSQSGAHHIRYTDAEAVSAIENDGALDISVTNTDMVDSQHASEFVNVAGDSMTGNLKVPSLKFSETVESDHKAGVIVSSETTNDKHTYIHNYDNSLLFIDDREIVNVQPVPDVGNTSDIFDDTKGQSAQWADWSASPITITIDSNNHSASSIDYIYFDFENGRYCTDIKAEYYDGSWTTFYNTTANSNALPFIHKDDFSAQVDGWVQLKFTFGGTLAYTNDFRIDEVGVFSPDEDEGFVMKRSGGNIYDTVDMNQNSIINASAYNGVDINTHITDQDAHHWHDDHYGLVRYQSAPPGTTKTEQVFIDTDDDTLQVYDGGAWVTIAGGGTAPQNLSDLNDISNVSYTDGYVLRGSGADYQSTQLNHSDLTGIGSGDHHTKYALTDDLTSNEIGQVQKIDTQTITNVQWGYLASMSSQPLESPMTSSLDMGGNNINDVNSVDGGGDSVRFDDAVDLNENNLTNVGNTNTIEPIENISDLPPADAVLNMNNHRITNVSAPTGVNDAVTVSWHNNKDHSDVASTIRLDELAVPTNAINFNSQDLDNVSSIDGGGNTITFNDDVDVNSIDWSEAFPNIIEQASEPSLTAGEWTVWFDTDANGGNGQMWLVINHGGDQRKVELA